LEVTKARRWKEFKAEKKNRGSRRKRGKRRSRRRWWRIVTTDFLTCDLHTRFSGLARGAPPDAPTMDTGDAVSYLWCFDAVLKPSWAHPFLFFLTPVLPIVRRS